MEEKKQLLLQKTRVGALISPQDPRDYTLARLAVPTLKTFPEAAEDYYPFKHLNQGNVGACVPHATFSVEMKSLLEYKKVLEELSPGFAYGYRTEGQYMGEGMIPVEYLTNAKKVGFVLKSDFEDYCEVPEIIEKVRLVQDKLIKGIKYKLTAFARLNSMNEVKSAILAPEIGVIVSVPLFVGWVDEAVKDGHLTIPAPGAVHDGNHMMVLRKYENGSKPHGGDVICRNTWGDDLVPDLYLPDGYPINEYWAVTGTIDVPKPTPDEPVEFYRILVDAEYKNVTDTDIMMAKLAKLKVTACIDMHAGKFIIQVGRGYTKIEQAKAKAYLDATAKKTGVKLKMVTY